MIDNIGIEDDGPDGTYLVIDDGERMHSFQLTDHQLSLLDAALQPWRDHRAAGEQVRRWYREHRGAGYCTGWVSGEGPCQLPYGHGGAHSRRKIFEEGEEV